MLAPTMNLELKLCDLGQGTYSPWLPPLHRLTNHWAVRLGELLNIKHSAGPMGGPQQMAALIIHDHLPPSSRITHLSSGADGYFPGPSAESQ